MENDFKKSIFKNPNKFKFENTNENRNSFAKFNLNITTSNRKTLFLVKEKSSFSANKIKDSTPITPVGSALMRNKNLSAYLSKRKKTKVVTLLKTDEDEFEKLTNEELLDVF